MTYKNEMFSFNSMEVIGKHRKAAMKLSQKNFAREWDPILSLLTSCIILPTPDILAVLDEPTRVEEAQTAQARPLLRRFLFSILPHHF